MATAFLSAKRSKDPCTQVGACIVNDEKRIVGVGYNGMPTGCSDDQFSWKKASSNSLDTKYLYGKFIPVFPVNGKSFVPRIFNLSCTTQFNTILVLQWCKIYSVSCRSQCYLE